VFDQIQYIIDTLNGDHPYRGPESRRMVVNAWHPANAAVSKLPPCHFSFVFNVQGDRLNLHLTQRSGDIALGVPFNIAAYALIARIIAQRTGFALGEFSHTIVDAHVYCGKDERGRFYADRLDAFQERLAAVESREGYAELRDWVDEEAPAEEEPGFDHVPGLLEQLSREPLERPRIRVADRPIDELGFDDIELLDYDSHDGIRFRVAE
jgi:thymidylate synthase